MWNPTPDDVKRIEEHPDNETEKILARLGKQEAKELAAEERKTAARERRASVKCWERVEKQQREENARDLSNTEMADKAAEWRAARASALALAPPPPLME